MTLLGLWLALAGSATAIDVKTDVVYSRPEPGVELKLDIYRPAEAKRPSQTVVLIHGGAWMGGIRHVMRPIAEAYAREGFVAVPISYRLAPKTKIGGLVNDPYTAVRFLRQHATDYGIDPDRIGVFGHSAGAHLALLLGYAPRFEKSATEWATQPEGVRAVVAFAAPIDLLKDFPQAQVNAILPVVLGKRLPEAEADLKLYSPATYVSKSCVPTFLLHGVADRTVPLAQSKRLEEQLRAVGIPVEACYLDGEDHLPFWDRDPWKGALAKSIAFMKKYVAKPGGLQVQEPAAAGF